MADTDHRPPLSPITDHRPPRWLPLTIDHDGGRQAPPPGHDVGSHAGVVARVGEPRLPDDQVVVGPGVDVLVQVGVDGLLVLQPLHLPGGAQGNVGQAKGTSAPR